MSHYLGAQCITYSTTEQLRFGQCRFFSSSSHWPIKKPRLVVAFAHSCHKADLPPGLRSVPALYPDGGPSNAGLVASRPPQPVGQACCLVMGFSPTKPLLQGFRKPFIRILPWNSARKRILLSRRIPFEPYVPRFRLRPRNAVALFSLVLAS